MPTLDWIGKSKVVNHHLDVPYKTLERQYSFDKDGQHTEDNDSENMIIHGDNLEALKSLLPQYEGRIKCIYIDPPYNTGNENWVYNDNVNDPRIKKWLGEVVGPEGDDLSRHDKWLCMMYPRLKLLHRLLAKDGAIFISIDFHEQAALKYLCDEIFGSHNYVAEIACVNSPKGRDKSKNADMSTAHEFITVYRKSNKFKMGGFEPEEHITKRYNKIDEITGEKYRLIDLRKTGNSDERVDRPNLFYPFFYNERNGHFYVGKETDRTPDGYIRIDPMKSSTVEGRWCWDQKKSKKEIEKLIPLYQTVKKQWSVFQKDYLEGRELVTPTTAWTFKDVNSERGTEMFQKYLGFKKNDFPNPKPVGTIERIIRIGSKPGDIILDSFAGSGTTAQAILNVNKGEEKKRTFILVEMMDYANSITAERVKRVVNGYGSGKYKLEGTGGDFSYYELGEPIFNGEMLNEAIGEDEIRKYVYFTETKQRLEPRKADEPYYLGKYVDNAYYFYYEKEQITTLNNDFLNTIQTTAGAYVIYADLCTLSDSELERYNITFKKIPRDITKL